MTPINSTSKAVCHVFALIEKDTTLSSFSASDARIGSESDPVLCLTNTCDRRR
jgi:hypothetical protein